MHGARPSARQPGAQFQAVVATGHWPFRFLLNPARACSSRFWQSKLLLDGARHLELKREHRIDSESPDGVPLGTGPS